TFIAYWLLGLSSVYLLGLTDYVVSAMGPTGFWIGFVIGLTFAAVMIFLRIRWLQKQPPEVTLQRAAHH
ncbi:MAG: MATE family efflux transporter, partial [Candidatus Regiella insecticola]|nr:MATE family efflux transporter [Candidatus Regiella insecticola]